MTRWMTDLRYAVRSLGKSPGYAAATVALLALGLGSTAAIFSMVHTALLRPLPFFEAERIVRVWETYSHGKGRGTVSAPNFRDWSEAADRFESLAAYWWSSRNILGQQQPERVGVLETSASFFEVLGAKPLLGRLLEPTDLQPGAPPVAVVSAGYWKRALGADPGVVGTAVKLDAVPHIVVGIVDLPVYARDFYLPHTEVVTDEQRGNHYLSVLAKVRSDATLDESRRQLEQIAARLEREYPDEQTGRSVEMRTLSETLRGPVRSSLRLLAAAVAVVLLIACTNLAGLAIARAAARWRETTIRAALGAGGRDLARHLLSESLLLVTAGALLGLLVAQAILQLVASHAAAVMPHVGTIALDYRALTALLSVGAGIGIVLGLVPVAVARRSDLARHLLAGAGRASLGRGRTRTRRLLVGAQIALSMTLLVGAGLLFRSFVNLLRTDPGFERTGVLTLHLPPRSDLQGAQLATRLLTPLVERVGALAGVEEAGVLSKLPVQDWGTNTSYRVEGLAEPAPGDEWWVESRAGSSGALRALGIPLRAGRWLTGTDALRPDGDEATPFPALVNAAFARRHFADDGEAIGRRVEFDAETVAEIVGVYGDTRQSGLDREAKPEITLAYNDRRFAPMLAGQDVVLVVRSPLDVAALTAELRRTVREVDPAQPVDRVMTVDQVLSASLGDRRFLLTLVVAFAVVALLLAGTGLYALIAYLVAQRRVEIGIRMALGASARAIGRWVVADGLGVTAYGLAFGVAGGWAASRLVAGQLHAVKPLDPLTWAAVGLVLTAVALTASLLPAFRAAATEPSTVLRQD